MAGLYIEGDHKMKVNKLLKITSLLLIIFGILQVVGFSALGGLLWYGVETEVVEYDADMAQLIMILIEAIFIAIFSTVAGFMGKAVETEKDMQNCWWLGWFLIIVSALNIIVNDDYSNIPLFLANIAADVFLPTLYVVGINKQRKLLVQSRWEEKNA